MGTKNNPGKYDCYDNMDPDEPHFVLRAKDPLAPTLVRMWLTLRKQLNPAEPGTAEYEKQEEALTCAVNMENWAKHKEIFEKFNQSRKKEVRPRL